MFVIIKADILEKKTHLWPSSCVIVWARVIPLSSLTLQLRSGWHIPATWATPKVLQGVFALEQISFLVTRIATSWWLGLESSKGFNFCCHLQKLYSVLSAFTVIFKSRWKKNCEVQDQALLRNWLSRVHSIYQICVMPDALNK